MPSILANAERHSSADVLQLERLQVQFDSPYGVVHAVRDLTLSVAAGECLGVVGESGAGKTQAFLAALGLLAPNGRASGQARFAGVELLGLPSSALDRIRGARIGLIFQDPMTALTPHLRIGDQIAEPLMRHRGVSRGEARSQALALLQRVHVNDAQRRLRQYPHELSGGMRQRVMIAAALACEPILLIADEPTTALDVTLQAQILSLLSELKRERALAMVLITHDLGAIAGLADRVAVMRAGELLEQGDVRAVLKNPRHAYTQSLLAAVPRIDQPLQFPAPAETDNALVLQDVRVQFDVPSGLLARRRKLCAVDGISLAVASGEALGIVGESGSGKSTLARAALRLLHAQQGRIVWLGRPVELLSQRELRALRRDTQIVFQDPQASLDPRLPVAEIIAEPLRVHRPELERAERAVLVAEALRNVELDPGLASRYAHELSGGQCQRVGIARAMVLAPRVLVCDEPVSALDATVQAQILTLLQRLKHQHRMSLLFISHNLAVVRSLCERVLVMYLGRMMELQSGATLFRRPRHPYTRELLECVPVPDPDVQPARLSRVLTGEPPSPLAPPSGCVYRTRCPHATDVCLREVPRWEATEEGAGRVACHRWKELAGTLSFE